ncbi:MAG TPA: hypothetical protein VMU59_14785 [Caulobacteraceae bacterium]|nr:hypothetical protein [Caulobacteraceae bacterium]
MTKSLARMAAALSLGLGVAAPLAHAQTGGDLSGFVGRWQIDPALTRMGRGNITRSPTFSFVFKPKPAGLQINVYAQYPQAAPDRVSDIIPDQKPHVCDNPTACQTVGGVPSEQTYTYFEMDSHNLFRIFYTKGKVTEYTNYMLSSDGQIFTMITWAPEAPQNQNIQVFHRQP